MPLPLSLGLQRKIIILIYIKTQLNNSLFCGTAHVQSMYANNTTKDTKAIDFRAIISSLQLCQLKNL